MRQFMAALAALLVALPAAAQIQVTPYNGVGGVTGTLTTIGDFVPINLSGGRWATVQWAVVGTAGTAGITTEISLDGGINWIPSAYSKRLDAVSANPSVAPWVSNAGVSNSAWETPLPGNATQFRLRCGATGTTTSVQLSGGAPYVPGVPVVATLYDATEGSIGAGLLSSTTTQDVSGWNTVTITGISPTTVAVTVRPNDDTGNIISGLATAFAAASTGALSLSRNGGSGAIAGVSAGSFVAGVLVARRIAWYLPTGGTVSTGRIRVEASR